MEFLTAAMPLVAILVGRLSPIVMEQLKASPAFGMFSNDKTGNVRLAIAVVAILAGSANMAMNGNPADPMVVIQSLADAALVWYANQAAYHGPGGVKEVTAAKTVAEDNRIVELVMNAMKTAASTFDADELNIKKK